MATDLFTKLNNIFGDQQNYADLHEASVEKAKNLSQIIFHSLSNPNPSEFEPTHRVAIIGAGLAGLSAAYFLLQEGVNVTLFEASDRSGGRVETDRNLVPGRLIEAGAELIGLNHPLWLTLARDLRLSLATVTPELHYVAAQLDIYVDLEEEAPREEDTVINARGLRLDQLRRLHGHMDAIYSKLNGLAEHVNAYRPWDADNAATLDQQSVSDWVQGLIMPDIPEADLSLAKQAILNELENDQCVSPNDQSLLGLLAAVAGGSLSELKEDRPSEYWTHSEVFRCADGNHKLAMKLLEACKEQYGDNFRYRQGVPITKLALPQGFKQLYWGNGKGENEVFDWVVFAVPSPTIFNSEHAAPIELAGDHPPRCPQNGAAVKYLTHVQRRFWMDRPQDAFAPSAFSGLLGSFWESTDNQTTSGAGDDGGIGISLFSGSRFADTVINYDQRNKLDTQIAEIFADFPANQADTKLLNWPERRFIGTGYSCPGIGELVANKDFFCRHHNGVIFAGEYTSAPLFGYMEGALQSGLRAAMLVMGRRVQSSPRFEGAASQGD